MMKAIDAFSIDGIRIEPTDIRFGETRVFDFDFKVERSDIDPGWFIWGREKRGHVIKRIAWPDGPLRKWPKRGRLVQPGFRTKADALAALPIVASALSKSNPDEIHIDIGSHNTGGKNVRAKNPISRVKKPTSPSQRERVDPVTGEVTKTVRKGSRLYERRLRTYHEATPGVWANPLTRVKVKSASQRTGEAPDEKLMKRRRKTAKAPPGFYANPLGSADVLVGISVNAGNDSNGNPRRGLLMVKILDGVEPTYIGFVPVIYSSAKQALSKSGYPADTAIIGEFDIAPAQFKAFKTRGERWLA